MLILLPPHAGMAVGRKRRVSLYQRRYQNITSDDIDSQPTSRKRSREPGRALKSKFHVNLKILHPVGCPGCAPCGVYSTLASSRISHPTFPCTIRPPGPPFVLGRSLQKKCADRCFRQPSGESAPSFWCLSYFSYLFAAVLTRLAFANKSRPVK